MNQPCESSGGDLCTPLGTGGDLEQVARRLRALAADRPDLVERADRLADRIATQRFHVAVVGEFKRGKSTLVNALVGRRILPTGVLPLTAVPTEVRLGPGGSAVTFTDGRRRGVRLDEIADYVTERGNPSNAKGVQRVEVVTESALDAPGLVLVDTPGVASVNEHNTQAARAALVDSDGALVVLSADSPMSESELAMLTELGQRRAKIFVVVNKCDHVDQGELQEVRGFITEHLGRVLGQWSGPYFVSAGTVLEGQAASPGPAAREFEVLRRDLEHFVRDDLARARRASIDAQIVRLMQSLDNALRIEAAASAMDSDTLCQQLRRFETAASEGRRQLHEDRVILDHEVELLVGQIGGRLAALAAAAVTESRLSLRALVDRLPVRHLDEGLRREIETLVRQRFAVIWLEVQGELDDGWSAAAVRFSARVQDRVDRLIETANELFAVHLPSVAVPAVKDQRERFSYHFLHVEGPNAAIGRLLIRLLPPMVARRRALRRADRRLAEEFDKHAGRAHYDLRQRVGESERKFAAAMEDEFEQTQSSLLAAANAARTLLSVGAEERAASQEVRRDLDALVTEAARLGLSMPGIH